MSKKTKPHPLELQTHDILPTHSVTDPKLTRAFAIEAARTLADAKCSDIVVLDVQGLSQITDFIVIGSGTSDRQMHAAAQHVGELAQEQHFPLFRRNVDERTTWIVLDLVDCIVHVFEPNARALYDLEMLWGDAPNVKWERPGEKRRHAPEPE